MIIPNEIDLDLVERVIAEGNRTEDKWLQDLLENGFKIYNASTKRYLKVDRFLKRLNVKES